ncbi:MAG TPA: hypothetical protein VGD87_16580 [Archangium sp.]
MKGRVRDLLDGMFSAVAHAAPVDRSTILAGSVREIAEQYDLAPRCTATRGLLPLSTSEYLEACGCPQPYAELTWARLAVLLDDQVDHAGWVPLNITEDRKATEVTLSRGATLQKLVDVLQDAPVRVTWTGSF